MLVVGVVVLPRKRSRSNDHAFSFCTADENIDLTSSQKVKALIRMETGTYSVSSHLDLVSGVQLEGNWKRSGADWQKHSNPGAASVASAQLKRYAYPFALSGGITLRTIIRRTTGSSQGPSSAPYISALWGESVTDFRLQDLVIETQNAPA